MIRRVRRPAPETSQGQGPRRFDEGPDLAADPVSREGAREPLDLPLAGTDAELGFQSLDDGRPVELKNRSRPPGYGRGTVRRRSGPWRTLGWVLLFLLVIPLGIFVGYSLKPLPAQPVLSTDLITFGETRVGDRGQKEILLSNVGEAPLSVLGIEVVDDPDSVFRLAAAPDCLGGQVTADSTCAIAVIYRPERPGSHQARLRVLTGSPASPTTQSLPLLGQGAAPSLLVEPTALTFALTPVGYRAEAQEVWLGNDGNARTTVRAVELTGPGATDFVAGQDRCTGSTLDPGERCSVAFEFVPTAAGDRDASVRVISDAGPSPSTSTLKGVGRAQEPRIDVQPRRVDFARVKVGERGLQTTVTLGNQGLGELNIQKITVAPVNGDRSSEVSDLFVLDPGTCLGAVLTAEQTCRLQVSFAPDGRGDHRAVLEVEHNAANAPYLLPLMGRGTEAELRLSVSSLAFGNVPVGSFGPWRGVELRNTGSAPLVVARTPLSGDDAAHFQVASEGCTRGPVEPGQSCTVQVRFRAYRQGPHRAELRLRHDGRSTADRVALNGIGTRPQLRLTPDELSFDSTPVGERSRLAVRVDNQGRGPQRVGGVRLEGLDRRDFRLVDGCAGLALKAGQSCVITVEFNPQGPGQRQGRLIVEPGSGAAPREIPVSASTAWD